MSANVAPIPDVHAKTLLDHSAYADGRINATWAWLRENDPIGRVVVDGYEPFWVVTRFDEIREISRDNRHFASARKSVVLIDQASEEKLAISTKPRLRMVNQMDPPDHMKYRALTQNWFSPKSLRQLETQITNIAIATVDKMRSLSGASDFVSDIAVHYPLEVILEILGIPKTDYPLMLKLTKELVAPNDPDSMPAGIDINDLTFMAKAREKTEALFVDYFTRVISDRRANPRDDIATVIAQAQIDGRPISLMDAMGYYVIIATAGHDTTSSSTAAAMYGLATVPGLLDRIKSDLNLIPALIEEAIRWATPAKHFMRTVTEDLEFGGRSFSANDWVMICHGSANQDTSRFPNPLVFDIDRPNREHMSFGYGPHICLGQHLARMEMSILMRQLIPSLEYVELTDEPEIIQSRVLNGFKYLPIQYGITPR